MNPASLRAGEEDEETPSSLRGSNRSANPATPNSLQSPTPHQESDSGGRDDATAALGGDALRAEAKDPAGQLSSSSKLVASPPLVTNQPLTFWRRSELDPLAEVVTAIGTSPEGSTPRRVAVGFASGRVLLFFSESAQQKWKQLSLNRSGEEAVHWLHVSSGAIAAGMGAQSVRWFNTSKPLTPTHASSLTMNHAKFKFDFVHIHGHSAHCTLLHHGRIVMLARPRPGTREIRWMELPGGGAPMRQAVVAEAGPSVEAVRSCYDEIQQRPMDLRCSEDGSTRQCIWLTMEKDETYRRLSVHDMTTQAELARLESLPDWTAPGGGGYRFADLDFTSEASLIVGNLGTRLMSWRWRVPNSSIRLDRRATHRGADILDFCVLPSPEGRTTLASLGEDKSIAISACDPSTGELRLMARIELPSASFTLRLPHQIHPFPPGQLLYSDDCGVHVAECGELEA